jgi:hypothetical protein
MTDYRLRNHDLLYAPRGKRPLNRRVVVIFSLIGAVVTFFVVSHLAGAFNASTPGVTTSRQAAPPTPIQMATPDAARPRS